MNNTDKLLRAFIEASGFDIEKLVDTKLTTISKQSGINRITSSAMTMRESGLATVNGNEYKRGDDECYYLKPSLDIDYKVTKKVGHYEFTKHMIENIIGVLEGHDNDDVHILINNLEVMINENI